MSILPLFLIIYLDLEYLALLVLFGLKHLWLYTNIILLLGIIECQNDGDILCHPENPVSYFQCMYGTIQEWQCPSSLVFNPRSSICDWPWNAGTCRCDRPIFQKYPVRALQSIEEGLYDAPSRPVLVTSQLMSNQSKGRTNYSSESYFNETADSARMFENTLLVNNLFDSMNNSLRNEESLGHKISTNPLLTTFSLVAVNNSDDNVPSFQPSKKTSLSKDVSNSINFQYGRLFILEKQRPQHKKHTRSNPKISDIFIRNASLFLGNSMHLNNHTKDGGTIPHPTSPSKDIKFTTIIVARKIKNGLLYEYKTTPKTDTDAVNMNKVFKNAYYNSIKTKRENFEEKVKPRFEKLQSAVQTNASGKVTFPLTSKLVLMMMFIVLM